MERFDSKEAAVKRLDELKPHSFALYKVDRVPVKVTKKTVKVQPPPEFKETTTYEVKK
jgi:hypothetical protein